VRQLSHGAIMHGYQFLDPARRRWPTAYFGPNTGADIAIRASRRGAGQKVGIVGLGAGTLAAYCRPGDNYRFYEINPLVTQLATTQFSYLSDCPGKVDVAPGDARLTLEAEPDQQFDLLILDAFSGDAIPVHLLTREAFATYFRHLKPGGVLAVHTSNLYLNLAPVVRSVADYYHRSAFLVSSRSNHALGTNAAQWVLLGPAERLLQFESVRPLPPAPSQRLWTDNYSSIAGILR
jgi:predicted methyltransferase